MKSAEGCSAEGCSAKGCRGAKERKDPIDQWTSGRDFKWILFVRFPSVDRVDRAARIDQWTRFQMDLCLCVFRPLTDRAARIDQWTRFQMDLVCAFSERWPCRKERTPVETWQCSAFPTWWTNSERRLPAKSVRVVMLQFLRQKKTNTHTPNTTLHTQKRWYGWMNDNFMIPSDNPMNPMIIRRLLMCIMYVWWLWSN